MLADRDREIAELKKALDEARRAGKRQAAPFSKGDPKPDPKRPGRKAGARYGRQGVLPSPEPDETVVVPCPEACPCGGGVTVREAVDLYQVDIPPVVRHVIKFVVHLGECVGCGRRVRGEDPRLTSKAVEVGRVHFGPRIIALGAFLKVFGGMSYGKIQTAFTEMLGFPLARSTVCRAVARLGRRGTPTYQELIRTIQSAPVVYADETGWKVGGERRWLWAATDKTTTVFRVARGRGYLDAEALLGKGFAGVLGVDGWAPYRCFLLATIQACNDHLLRRCREMLETAAGPAADFPADVRDALKQGLRLRDRRDEDRITPHGLSVATGLLEAKFDRLIAGANLSDPANATFAKHLLNYRDNLFVYLGEPGIEATNWPAEHEMRLAAVNRKNAGGGNRTDAGAAAYSVVLSILQTARHFGCDLVDVFSQVLRGSTIHFNTAPPR